jgi:serine/threonine protein kinase
MAASEKRRGYYCPHCHNAVDAEDSICLSCNAERRGAWPLDPYVGRTIGRKYRVTRRLTASDAGVVFSATQVHQDTELGRVIIKMLSQKLSGDRSVIDRFVSEARAARTLSSPHMVRVFDLEYESGHAPYLVMENVEGDTLEEILVQDEQLDPSRALGIALQVAEAMEEAHQKHILHRNLRPSNVVVRQRDRDDFIKLIGFSPAHTPATGGRRTPGGGDPYVSPEVRTGGEGDERSDVWSLGAILHAMLTGGPPRPDRSVGAAVTDLPLAIVETVDAMLSTDPAGRPADMSRVAMLLEQAAHEAGYTTDITGRITLPQGGPPGGRSSTPPTSSPPPAPRSTSRPPSVPPPPDREPGGRPRPLLVTLMVLAGVGVIVIVAASVAALWLLYRAQAPSPEAPPGVETAAPPPAPELGGDRPFPPPPLAAEDAAAEPAQRGDAGEDPGVEEPPAEPAGQEPPAPVRPAPPVKKKPREAEPEEEPSPWTKLK